LEILLLLLVLGLAFLYVYLGSPTVIGAAGERRVNAALKSYLNQQDYILLDDLTLPTSSGTTQIDHVVVSRYGIFVIETKNMSGWIFGSETQPRWTQTMRRHKSQFQNPLRQNYYHLKVIQNLLGIRLDQLENLVAFVGSAQPKTEMPPNVFWSRSRLVRYIAAQQTIRFTDDQVREFAAKLRDNALENNRETRRVHVHNVRAKVNEKVANKTNCPRCGSKMIERTNRKTGQNFYGCTRYPKCQGTR
jgi:restriction system protein